MSESTDEATQEASTETESCAQVEPTPGPWVVRQVMTGDCYVDDASGEINITGQIRSSTGAFSDEAEVNAHLIAAAPRLLSELEEVHGLLVRLKATHGHFVRRELIDNVEEALAAARNREV